MWIWLEDLPGAKLLSTRQCLHPGQTTWRHPSADLVTSQRYRADGHGIIYGSAVSYTSDFRANKNLRSDIPKREPYLEPEGRESARHPADSYRAPEVGNLKSTVWANSPPRVLRGRWSSANPQPGYEMEPSFQAVADPGWSLQTRWLQHCSHKRRKVHDPVTRLVLTIV